MKLAFPTSTDLQGIAAWAKRLVEDLNKRLAVDDLPTANDDADAAAKNIKVGAGYVKPTGEVMRRVA
jgi:soluble lytic murein transglycosylase-like protein